MGWLYFGVAFHLLCALALAPVTSHPYDIAALTGNTEAWLRWGFSPLYNWKFGLDYSLLTFLTQALRSLLAATGVPGVVAVHVAWKAPLIAADLLTAGAIYRLALWMAPDRAVLLAFLWLVNPAVLWVSAGHGQIEPVAILTVFGALVLAREGRLFLAGLATGFGAGFEYFPVAVLGSAFLWWRGGYLRGRHPMVAFCLGLGLALLICFAPSLVDPVGRNGLLGGLLFSGGYSPAPNFSGLSVWGWLGVRWAPLWPFIFGLAGIVSFGIGWLYAKRSHAVALWFLAIVMILAVLLDANALPLFALIAGAGLWLIALIVPVSPMGMLAVPTAGTATYLVFLDRGFNTANAFFYDALESSTAHLWPVPRSGQAAEFLGHLFSLGLVATILYAVVRLGRQSLANSITAIVPGIVVCLLLVAWVSQPFVWQSAFKSQPTADVPDFRQFIATRAGSLEFDEPNAWRVSYPDDLVSVSSRATVKPAAGLEVSMDDLQGVTTVTTADALTVRIPDWRRLRVSIQSLWVVVLIGSPEWSLAPPLVASPATLTANGWNFVVQSTQAVTSQQGQLRWAWADFEVFSNVVGDVGLLQIVPTPDWQLWPGPNGVRVVPSSGVMQAQVDSVPLDIHYHLDPSGAGYALGLPLRGTFVVRLNSAQGLPPYQIRNAVLQWPDTPNSWLSSPSLQAIGAAYGFALIVLTVWLIRVQLHSMSPQRTSQSAGLATTDVLGTPKMESDR